MIARYSTALLFAAVMWTSAGGRAQTPQSAATPSPWLTNAQQILCYQPRDPKAVEPARLKGVVVFADPAWSIWFLRDGTGSVFLDRRDRVYNLQAGMEVEVVGDALLSAFAPILRESGCRILGNPGLPPASEVLFDQLIGGRLDSQWIQLEAIISAARVEAGHWHLESRVPGPLDVYVPGPLPAVGPDGLVDSRVRLRGACATSFNTHGQMTGYKLFVPSAEAITVIEPAPADPFSLPSLPLADHLSYARANQFGHRFKSHGVVTATVSPTEFYLQDSTGAARVRTARPTQIDTGDDVEVSGFPGMEGATLHLRESVVRKLGQGLMPKPIRLNPEGELKDSWNSCLATASGELMGSVSVSGLGDSELLIRSGSRDWVVRLDLTKQSRRLTRLEAGCRLEVTGICTLTLDEYQNANGVQVLLRGPDDIRLLRPGPWWTKERLKACLMVLLILIVAGCFFYISSHRLAEQELRESEARFRRLGEAAFEAIVLSENGVVVDGNPQVCALLGYPLKELVGLQVLDLVAPESREIVNQHIGISDEGLYQNTLLRKDGSTVVVESRAKHMLTQGRRLRITALRDLTERKHAEELLRQERALFRTVIDNIPFPIYAKDAQARKILANPADVRNIGASCEADLLHKDDFDLFPRPLAEKFYAVDQLVLKGGAPQIEVEDRFDKPTGPPVWLLSTKIPVFDASGQVTGLVGISRDISETKRAENLEEQLRRAQRLESVGQLAGGVAHDFNNILAGTMLQLDLISQRPNLDEEIRAGLKEVTKHSQRAANLVKQLLMFSRKSALEIKRLDLNDLIANLLKMIKRVIGEHIVMRFEPKVGLPVVEADPGMIEQVLMNLCVNARDAMPRGGELTIELAGLSIDESTVSQHPQGRPGQFVRLSVTDTGIGMEEGLVARIFDPFFTTKEAGKGTGLGLATVHGIVGQHRGWVEVDSQIGRGSSFGVFLPAVALALTGKTLAREPVLLGGKETILIVEDEPALRSLVLDCLQGLGYTVREAVDGPQALQVWQDCGGSIDVLFSDMVMPGGLTGVDLAKKFQTDNPRLRVIISSGYSAEFSENLVSGRQFFRLPKPYRLEALARVVRECLEENRHVNLPTTLAY